MGSQVQCHYPHLFLCFIRNINKGKHIDMIKLFLFVGMGRLLFLVALISFGHTEANVAKIEAGIDAGKAILNALNAKGNNKYIGPLMQKIGPFLDAIGPVLGVIKQSTSSPQTREFAKINKKLDRIFHTIDGLKNLIEKMEIKLGLKVDYGIHEQRITSLYDKLQNMMNAPNRNTFITFRDKFLRQYKYNYDSATFNIWNGMMDNKTVIVSNIPLAAMKYFSYEKEKVMGFLDRIFDLILKGVRVELAYETLIGKHQNYGVLKSHWENKTRELLTKMDSDEEKVEENMIKHRLDRDISRKLKAASGQGHYTFGRNLYNFLKKSYNWRDWHVLVFDPLSGGNSWTNGGGLFWVKWCNGYRRFRHWGRNLVVASVDKDKPPINKYDAGHKLGQVTTWGHRECTVTTAECIFKYDFPSNMKWGCSTYASAGVIMKDFWSGTSTTIVHYAPRKRLALRYKGDFALYAFG